MQQDKYVKAVKDMTQAEREAYADALTQEAKAPIEVLFNADQSRLKGLIVDKEGRVLDVLMEGNEEAKYESMAYQNWMCAKITNILYIMEGGYVEFIDQRGLTGESMLSIKTFKRLTDYQLKQQQL